MVPGVKAEQDPSIPAWVLVWIFVAATLAVLPAAGCGSGRPSTTGSTPSPSAAAATSTVAASSPSLSTSPSPSTRPHAFGEEVTIDIAKATVLAYQQPTALDAPAPKQT